MDRENAGLHTWGNVLYSCVKCNNQKDKCDGGWKQYMSNLKPESKKLIKNWQKLYSPGEWQSQRLTKVCKVLYQKVSSLI